jgi:hypothetical protein
VAKVKIAQYEKANFFLKINIKQEQFKEKSLKRSP